MQNITFINSVLGLLNYKARATSNVAICYYSSNKGMEKDSCL